MGFFSKETPEVTEMKARLAGSEKRLGETIAARSTLIESENALVAQKWEYKIEDNNYIGVTEAHRVDFLNDAGQQGWELVSAFSYGNTMSTSSMNLRYVFKRPFAAQSSESVKAMNREVSTLEKEIADLKARIKAS